MMALAAIEAQDPALRVLDQALRGGRLAQAYLFVGPSGVGKQLTALSLARAAICAERPGEGCGACETCRRIDQGVHPDVRVFAPRDEGNRNLPVEFVRSEVLPFAKFAPFEAKEAFVIFPQADVSFPIQHPEAANALLKTLEEPRAHVHFLLLSERPDRLLTTIRSRCQRVRFAQLPAAALSRILERHGVAEAARGPAIALARGRADRALELAEGDRALLMLESALRIDQAIERRAPAALLEIAEQLGGSDDRALVLDSLSALYRDIAALGLGVPREQLAFADRADTIAERARTLAPAAAAARVAKLHELDEQLAVNANPELALDGLLLQLGAV
jgi:DNA polymerase-3 subunit delta'